MPKTLMQSVATQLQNERKRLQNELHRVTAALTAFGKVYVNGSNPSKKRTMSAAGRKRIVAAQRARWAKVRAGNGPNKKVVNMPKKRTLSAAARKRIAAAQRARWAKLRAKKAA
jgi:hypothetical protein